MLIQLSTGTEEGTEASSKAVSRPLLVKILLADDHMTVLHCHDSCQQHDLEDEDTLRVHGRSIERKYRSKWSIGGF